MTADRPYRALRDALRIVTIYGVVAALWINLSEPVLLLLSRDATTLMWLGEIKGFIFIAITGMLLYALILRHMESAYATESDLRIVQALLEETTDAVFLKDRDLRYLLFNKAAAQFGGCNPDDVVGHDDTFIFNEDDAKSLRASDEEILHGGRVQTKEEHLTTPDGVRRTFFVTKGPLYDERQQLYGLFGIARDITDRKRVEEQLSESEMLLRALFENMQEGFAFCEMLFDAAGRPVDFTYLNVNPAFARLTGLTDVTGRRVSEVIPGIARQHPELLEAYGAVARGGPPTSFDIEFLPLDRWLSLSIYSTGSPYFAVVFEDITARKRTEQALRETGQRLDLANEAAGIGIWDWDVKSGSVVLDDRMDALYDKPRGTLSSGLDAWMAAIHADDRQGVRDGMEAALTGKAPLQLRLRVPLADGALRTLDITGTVMRNENGEAVRVIGICRNVTEQLGLEAQLREALKMEAIGRLAGGVAHDFNNMLTAIMGYAELLQSGLEPESPLRTYVDDMLISAERAATLTRDLLAFSRRQMMRRVPVEVNGVLHGLNNMLARIIGDEIVIRVVTPAPDIVVRGDRSQLENVLINLAANARDAMLGGGTLTLSTRSVEIDERFALEHPDATPGAMP